MSTPLSDMSLVKLAWTKYKGEFKGRWRSLQQHMTFQFAIVVVLLPIYGIFHYTLIAFSINEKLVWNIIGTIVGFLIFSIFIIFIIRLIVFVIFPGYRHRRSEYRHYNPDRNINLPAPVQYFIEFFVRFWRP